MYLDSVLLFHNIVKLDDINTRQHVTKVPNYVSNNS